MTCNTLQKFTNLPNTSNKQRKGSKHGYKHTFVKVCKVSKCLLHEKGSIGIILTLVKQTALIKEVSYKGWFATATKPAV